MDEKRLENLIEETLSTMDPVEIPKDLHFDAAKIMRLARMEEEEEAARQPETRSFMDRLMERFQSRTWTRFAAAAAAFALVLGVYGMTRDGGKIPGMPGTDPTQVADIGDNEIPLAGPGGEDEIVEEDSSDVVDTPEFAGGLELSPEEEESIWEEMLQKALLNEAFAKEFAAQDRGFGYRIRNAEDVPEGTLFMIYFYESLEEQTSGIVREDSIRSILWKKES